jgi:hypothetical protein
MNKFRQSVTKKLDDIIDDIIAETEDGYTDDMLVDLMENPDKRQEAFEYLLDIAEEELGYYAN